MQHRAPLAPPGQYPAAPPTPAQTLIPLPAADVPRLPSAQLFGQGTEVHIEHGGAVYRLRITSLGKLILTK